MPPHDVVITGIGLLSSLGEGIASHVGALTNPEPAKPSTDSERFAPYTIHPLVPVDWSGQIPKRGDQRQMEHWQKLGTYAAGLALDDAGVPPDEAFRAGVDMIVAAGGGERDVALDSEIMRTLRGRNEDGLNELLMGGLRPTLFLAQLSNLLAGNISIVHKVTGSSRTFMGEEGAGLSALQVAAARIRAGQSGICLVGGAYSAEREDLLLNYELGGYLETNGWRPVFERDAGSGGLIPGSVGAFLVLESREHATERKARIHARLGPIVADRGTREETALAARLGALLDGAETMEPTEIFSGASGMAGASATELRTLRERFPHAPVHPYGSFLGHSFEAQFPAGIALAAAALSGDHAFCGPEATDRDAERRPTRSALVTTVGHRQAEGLCVLHAAGEQN